MCFAAKKAVFTSNVSFTYGQLEYILLHTNFITNLIRNCLFYGYNGGLNPKNNIFQTCHITLTYNL